MRGSMLLLADAFFSLVIGRVVALTPSSYAADPLTSIGGRSHSESLAQYLGDPDANGREALLGACLYIIVVVIII